MKNKNSKQTASYAPGPEDAGLAPRAGLSKAFALEPQRFATLVRTIEAEIVPRLLIGSLSAGGPRTSEASASAAPDECDVDELARILVTHGASMAGEFVNVIHRRGAPYDRICLELLAPAARRLVAGWEQHQISYPQLDRGLETLRELVQEVTNAARHCRPVSLRH